MTGALEFLEGLHPVAVYVVLGLGAAIENVIPPIPADTFVLVGGFIAGQGRASVVGIFLVTWLANVGSALAVYGVGVRYGTGFFEGRLGQRLLSPGQLEAVDRFYRNWGVAALFVTRFLPGLRAVVPVFAGVSKEPVRRVLPPIIVASALWYGALVALGASARGNLAQIEAWMTDANRGFLAAAAVAITVIFVWWRRSRSSEQNDG